MWENAILPIVPIYFQINNLREAIDLLIIPGFPVFSE